MKKKYKVLLAGSILVNVVLIITLIAGYLQWSQVHETVYLADVQWRLVELDGVILDQREDDWSKPDLVVTKLDSVLDGLRGANEITRGSHWLSRAEEKRLQRLEAALQMFPHNESYGFVEITKRDQEAFEGLQLKLEEAGIAMGGMMSDDWDAFMEKSERLVRLMEE